MVLQHVFGVDLGSDTIKIYSLKKDEILIEKNMIAIRNKEEVLAVGNDAYEMYEKAPHNIEVSSPMSGGMIANIGHLEVVLHLLLRKLNKHFGSRPIVYFSVPMNMTEIEKRAYNTIASGGDLRKSRIFLVERPIVNALSLGIPISKSKGSMIVDMGAECTEISVLADNRVIISKPLSFGGNRIDEAIVSNVRKRCGLHISRRMASRLKTAMAGLSSNVIEARKVVGLDTISGLPKEGVVSSAVINEVIRNQLSQAADEIQLFLERTPPQIHNSITREGIYLTGGCTRIEHIDTYLAEQIGCAAHISQYSDASAVYGLKEIITHKSLQHWAFTAKSSNKKYRF
jgi:rod shape-determining protein MreB